MGRGTRRTGTCWLLHGRISCRGSASLRLRGRGTRGWPSLSGALQNLHLMSSLLASLSKTRSRLLQREWPSTAFCLVPSGENRQLVDEP